MSWQNRDNRRYRAQQADIAAITGTDSSLTDAVAAAQADASTGIANAATAQGTATAAQSAASTANDAAASALAAAVVAQGAADDAQADATTGISDAGAAATAASNAQAAADSASGEAASALAAATAAQGSIGGLTGSTTWDPGSILTGASTSTTVTVTGAALGDLCLASLGVAVPAGVVLAAVTNTNEVTVTLANLSVGSVDLASSTVSVRVLQ